MKDPSPLQSSSQAAEHSPSEARVPCALTELNPGDHGRLHSAELVESDRQLLGALGLVEKSRLRLCKAGAPWIIQVRGTRIGLADDVARRLQILPEGPDEATSEANTSEAN